MRRRNIKQQSRRVRKKHQGTFIAKAGQPGSIQCGRPKQAKSLAIKVDNGVNTVKYLKESQKTSLSLASLHFEKSIENIIIIFNDSL
jgi:L-asparaginase II